MSDMCRDEENQLHGQLGQEGSSNYIIAPAGKCCKWWVLRALKKSTSALGQRNCLATGSHGNNCEACAGFAKSAQVDFAGAGASYNRQAGETAPANEGNLDLSNTLVIGNA